MKKKIIYIILLVVILAAVVCFFVFQNGIKKIDKSNTNTVATAGSNKDNNVQNTNKTEKVETTKTELGDGTLYTISNEEIKADIVIGDNYYDTQISDMMTNYNNYQDKYIEIEGMYLDGEPYTFVGRYSNSNLCAYCPVGYSYMEYIWDGEEIELNNEKTWIKVVGQLQKGNDETSYFQDYYYLKAVSIEVMNEKGIDTVNN